MKLNQIDPQTVLSTLFTRWPQTIPFFNARRFQCVGCSISSLDTLKDAAANYGISLEPFLNELQGVVDGLSGSNPITH